MSLVREYYASPDTYSKLLQAIHAVGKSCKIDVIAEGVEKSEYVDSLHALGIEQFQGYFFGKGVPLADFIDAHAARFAPSR
jgi:EAL domain-containing protein (putative c-di-GMP-specific phosphodiesterase class I)